MLKYVNKVLSLFNAVPFNFMPSWASLFFIRPIIDESAAPVSAYLASKDADIETNYGTLKAKAYLHYIVSDGKDKWPVRKDIFEKTYLEVDDHLYKKRPNVIFTAYIAKKAHKIYTLEGTIMADVGDYVIIGSVGEQWAVTSEQFEKKYRPYFF